MIRVRIEKNSYHDSVALMSLTGKINQLAGIKEAVVSMGTTMNKQLLGNVGMLTDEAAASTENDLVIAVRGESEQAVEAAFQVIEEEFHARKKQKKKGETVIQTWSAAVQELPDASMVVLSVPGEHAFREAKRALADDRNVMIFSDNVSLEEEKILKDYASEKGLFVMGPDCGTAIINGIGLCFANKVNRGSIGLVAASGTGLQEVTVQIHKLGYGISQAIGTGGRDLHEYIGGTMMIEGIRALQEDEETGVIVLVSKPPEPSVQKKIVLELVNSSKPVVVCFLDGDMAEIEQAGLYAADTLYDTAVYATQLLESRIPASSSPIPPFLIQEIREQKSKLSPQQKDIRGLFCGGTLTAEALSILRKEGLRLKSNVAKKPEEKYAAGSQSVGHTLLDLGDDEFTLGKPHPMIEPSLRNERILAEAADPAAAVLYLDFVLGYGAHEDPVGVTLPAIQEAKRIAENSGRFLPVIAYVCGTDQDKQDKSEQIRILTEAGVLIADSNKDAALIAAQFVTQ